MNKKIINVLFICFIGLFLLSAVSAEDEVQTNDNITDSYQITSDLSNDDIQGMFDNANEGDTFEFTDDEYKNISLVVNKKLNIVSNKNSVVYSNGQISQRANAMGITDTFGFYFTSNSCGSILSGIKLIASNSDYGVIVDSSDKTIITDNVIAGGINSVLVKNAKGVDI